MTWKSDSSIQVKVCIGVKKKKSNKYKNKTGDPRLKRRTRTFWRRKDDRHNAIFQQEFLGHVRFKMFKFRRRISATAKTVSVGEPSLSLLSPKLIVNRRIFIGSYT